MTFISPRKRPTIDVRGPDGNAFALMGYAQNVGRQMGKSTEEIAAIQARMRSSDYTDLLITFEENFGDVVDLVLSDELREQVEGRLAKAKEQSSPSPRRSPRPA